MSSLDISQRGPLPSHPLSQSKASSYHLQQQPTKKVKELHNELLIKAQKDREATAKVRILKKISYEMLKNTGSDNVAKLLTNPDAHKAMEILRKTSEPNWIAHMINNSPLRDGITVIKEKVDLKNDQLVIIFRNLSGRKEKLYIPIKDTSTPQDNVEDALSFAHIKAFYTLLKLGYEEVLLIQKVENPHQKSSPGKNTPFFEAAGAALEKTSSSSGALFETASNITSEVDCAAALNYVKHVIELVTALQKRKQASHYKKLAKNASTTSEAKFYIKKSKELTAEARWKISKSLGGISATTGIVTGGALTLMDSLEKGTGLAAAGTAAGLAGAAAGATIGTLSLGREFYRGQEAISVLKRLENLGREADSYFERHMDPEFQELVDDLISQDHTEINTIVNSACLGIGASGAVVLGSSLAIVLTGSVLLAAPTGGISFAIGGATLAAIGLSGGKGLYVQSKQKAEDKRESEHALRSPLKTRAGIWAELAFRLENDPDKKARKFIRESIVEKYLRQTTEEFLTTRKILSEELKKNHLHLYRGIERALKDKFSSLKISSLPHAKVMVIGNKVLPIEKGEGKGEDYAH